VALARHIPCPDLDPIDMMFAKPKTPLGEVRRAFHRCRLAPDRQPVWPIPPSRVCRIHPSRRFWSMLRPTGSGPCGRECPL